MHEDCAKAPKNSPMLYSVCWKQMNLNNLGWITDCAAFSKPWKLHWVTSLVVRYVRMWGCWQKKVWWINTSTNRLLIVNTNLDGFSLVDHGWFAKFAKLSCFTVYRKLHSYALYKYTNKKDLSAIVKNTEQLIPALVQPLLLPYFLKVFYLLMPCYNHMIWYTYHMNCYSNSFLYSFSPSWTCANQANTI